MIVMRYSNALEFYVHVLQYKPIYYTVTLSLFWDQKVMKSSRQPYQAPELIILELSVKDNSNPTEKGHNAYEGTIRNGSHFAIEGPQGKPSHTFANDPTPAVS